MASDLIIVAIKDKVRVLYRRINHKLPGGIMDQVRYSIQTNSFMAIIKTGMILTQKRLLI